MPVVRPIPVRSPLDQVNQADGPYVTSLFPAAWVWLAVPCAPSVLFNRSGSFGTFADSYAGSVAAFLQVANVHFAFVRGSHPAGAVFPCWSLSLEEQLYPGLPLLLLVAGRRLLPVLVAVLAARLFAEPLSLQGPFRITALALGVLLAPPAPGGKWWSRPARGTARAKPTAGIQRGLAGQPLSKWGIESGIGTEIST